MVGKWYKYIGKKDKYFTPNKWYLCQELDSDGDLRFIDNDNNIDELNWFFSEKLNENIDLSNPMEYNPDEVKEEEKPKLEVCDSITIEISSDGKVSIKSTLSRFETIYLLKKVTESEIDKINEE